MAACRAAGVSGTPSKTILPTSRRAGCAAATPAPCWCRRRPPLGSRPMITPILMLGAGRMGGAMVEGWLAAGAFGPGDLMIRDPQPSPAAVAAAKAGAVLDPPDAELARA